MKERSKWKKRILKATEKTKTKEKNPQTNKVLDVGWEMNWKNIGRKYEENFESEDGHNKWKKCAQNKYFMNAL